jgi:cell division protein FtsW (lipid II flippase)
MVRQGLGLAVGSPGHDFSGALAVSGVSDLRQRSVWILSVALLIFTLLFGTRLRGSRSWIDLGSLLFPAGGNNPIGPGGGHRGLCQRAVEGFALLAGSIPPLLLAGVHFGLVLLQPDLSSALVMAPMTLAIFSPRGCPWVFCALLLATTFIALGIPLTGTYFSVVSDRWVDHRWMMWVSRAFKKRGPSCCCGPGWRWR